MSACSPRISIVSPSIISFETQEKLSEIVIGSDLYWDETMEWYAGSSCSHSHLTKEGVSHLAELIKAVEGEDTVVTIAVRCDCCGREEFEF